MPLNSFIFLVLVVFDDDDNNDDDDDDTMVVGYEDELEEGVQITKS